MKYSKLILLVFTVAFASCGKDMDVPSDGDVVIDRIGGKFSVSDSKQVFFSPGNLQYNAALNRWRFAENQYDCIADGNAYASSHYDGWIDLSAGERQAFLLPRTAHPPMPPTTSTMQAGPRTTIATGEGLTRYRTMEQVRACGAR